MLCFQNQNDNLKKWNADNADFADIHDQLL